MFTTFYRLKVSKAFINAMSTDSWLVFIIIFLGNAKMYTRDYQEKAAKSVVACA